MSDALFNTVLQATFNEAQQNLAHQRQQRMLRQQRQDQINVAVGNSLTQALTQVNAYTKNLQDREVKLAQLRAQATGQTQTTGSAVAQRASEVGAQQRRSALTDEARKAEQKAMQARQEFVQDVALEGVKSQDRQELARSKFDMGQDRWEAEQRVREARLKAYERGASKTQVNVAAPNPEGLFRAKTIDKFFEDGTNDQIIARQLRRSASTLSPDTFNKFKRLQGTAYTWLETFGKDLSPSEAELVGRLASNQSDLTLTTLQLVKPLLGVMTGRDYEIAQSIVSQVNTSILGGAGYTEVKAQLESIADRFQDQGDVKVSVGLGGRAKTGELQGPSDRARPEPQEAEAGTSLQERYNALRQKGLTKEQVAKELGLTQ